MKTYVEISQPTQSNLLAIRLEKFQSLIQSLSARVKGMSLRKCTILVALLSVIIALLCRCHPFALIMFPLFIIALGILVNEFVQYIRFIREMK